MTLTRGKRGSYAAASIVAGLTLRKLAHYNLAFTSRSAALVIITEHANRTRGGNVHGSEGRYQRVWPHRPQHFRAALGNTEFDFVAVNDLTSTETLAHLLKYDSILGNLHHAVKASGDTINVEGDSVKVLSVKNPAELPWKDLGVDIVFESTGLFTDREKPRRST